MDRNAPVIQGTLKVSELADLIARHDPQVSKRQGTLILDSIRRSWWVSLPVEMLCEP